MFLSMAFFNRDDVCILAKNSSLLKSFAKKSQGARFNSIGAVFQQ